METEVDKYSLDCKVKSFSLKVCLINDQKILLELTNKNGPEIYRTLLSLDQLKDLSFAFYSAETILHGIIIIKNTIESGRIAVEEKVNESKVELELNIFEDSIEYPPVIINLLAVQNNGIQQNSNQIFNYQGDQELEAKYANIDHDTTEVNSIVESTTNPNVMELEYIQPIVQYHYPDGTTRSTPLTPKLQGAGGKKPNISQEQLNNLKEMINNDTKKRGRGRSLSPGRRPSNQVKRAYYETRTMPHLNKSNNLRTNQFNETDSVGGEGEEVYEENVDENDNPETFDDNNEYNLLDTPNQTLEVNNLNAAANPYQTASYAPLAQSVAFNNINPTISIPFVFMQPNSQPSLMHSMPSIPVFPNSFIQNQIPLQNSLYQNLQGSYLQQSQFYSQPRVDMMGNEYYMGSYSPGINPYYPYSLTYPKKYYFPKFK